MKLELEIRNGNVVTFGEERTNPAGFFPRMIRETLGICVKVFTDDNGKNFYISAVDTEENDGWNIPKVNFTWDMQEPVEHRIQRALVRIKGAISPIKTKTITIEF